MIHARPYLSALIHDCNISVLHQYLFSSHNISSLSPALHQSDTRFLHSSYFIISIIFSFSQSFPLFSPGSLECFILSLLIRTPSVFISLSISSLLTQFVELKAFPTRARKNSPNNDARHHSNHTQYPSNHLEHPSNHSKLRSNHLEHHSIHLEHPSNHFEHTNNHHQQTPWTPN